MKSLKCIQRMKSLDQKKIIKIVEWVLFLLLIYVILDTHEKIQTINIRLKACNVTPKTLNCWLSDNETICLEKIREGGESLLSR